MIKEGLSVCLYVYMYPFSAHSFGPINMKLGLDIIWTLGVTRDRVRLRFVTYKEAKQLRMRVPSTKPREEKRPRM